MVGPLQGEGVGDVTILLGIAGEVAQDLVMDVLEVLVVDGDLAVLKVLNNTYGERRGDEGN